MPHRSPGQKGHRDRTSPTRIQRTTLEAQAVQYRREGHSFSEIAEMLGISGRDPDARARYLVETALERKGKPDVNAHRTDQLDRLDRLFNRAMRIALQDKPDRVSAINAAVNVASRMANLMGTDAPKQLDIKDERSAPVDEAAAKKLVERLAQEAQREQSGGGDSAPAGTPPGSTAVGS